MLGALGARVPEIGRVRLEGATCSAADVAGFLRSPGFLPGRLVEVDEPPWILAGRPGDAERADDAEARIQADLPADGAPGRGRGRKAAGPDQALLDYLDAPAPDAILVLRTVGEPDRRRRLTKGILERGAVLAAEAPRDNGPWLRERSQEIGLRLPAAQFATLSRRLAGATCERMASELDKLAAFDGPWSAAALDALVPPEAHERIFDLLDAAVGGDGGPALRMGRALADQGEPVPRILYMLGNHLRSIAGVAEACAAGIRPEAAAPSLGLHPFVARKAFDQSRRLGGTALATAMEAVWDAELALKTGALSDSAALDAALLGAVRAARHLPSPAGQGSRGGELPTR